MDFGRDMSCQRGNVNRSRPQKYRNRTAFKNNLHDNSRKIKQLNNIKITNVCERCKQIIEWKIKYKKYKVLKAPTKCIRCQQKTVKHSYHSICLLCAKRQEICSKCGKKSEIVRGDLDEEEQIELDAEFQASLSERERRTFLRHANRQQSKNKNHAVRISEVETNMDGIDPKTKQDLSIKLKSLAIADDDDSVSSDSETDEGESDNFDNLDVFG